MKKITAVLAALAMLVSLCSCLGANGGKDETTTTGESVTQLEFEPSVGYEEGTKMIAVAVAMGMRYCTETGSLSKPAVIEDILGWYCARQSYSGGKDYLTLDQVSAIQHSILPGVTPLDMSLFTSEGIMEKDKNYEGEIFKFPVYVNSYKGLFSNFEISSNYPDKDGGKFTVTLRDRVFDTAKEVFTFTFEPDPNAAEDYPYVLTDFALPEKSEAATPQDAPFTVDDLFEANRTEKLIDKYGTIHVNEDNGDYGSGDSYYYKWKDHYIEGSEYIYVDGEISYNFVIDNYYLGYSDAHYIANEYIGSEPDFFENENSLNYFGIGKITDYEEKGDICSFRINAEMLEEGIRTDCYYEVKKDDLSLQKAIFKDEIGGTQTVTVTYGGKVDTYGLTDGWDENPERTITVAITMYDMEKGQADVGYEVTLPYNIELKFYSYSECFCYLNSGYTEEYSYPGDGVDYSVYVTNAAG